MRRTGHIRERSPGSFELRYSLGTDPATGKRKIATATIRGTKKDADKELRRLLSAVDNGDHVNSTRMTVRDWLTTWLATAREEVAPGTHGFYVQIVERFLAPTLGNLPIAKMTVAHIQECYSALAQGGRRDGKPGGLSPQTRRHVHRVLSAALSRAVDQQLIARNPCDAFRKRLIRVERREMLVLSVEQSTRLLEAIRAHRVYWPVLIALATGARRGEILALRWRNVDLDTNTVTIERSLEHSKAGLRFKVPKSGKARAVVLPRLAIDELRRLKREQAEELLQQGVRLDGDTLLCAKADGSAMLPTSLTHEFAKVARKVVGVPRVRFHDLRHSHATQLLRGGIHPKVAQERLGHSSISITMDLYSHVSETMQVEAAQRLDQLWQKNGRIGPVR
jgi:integrase